MMVALHKYIPTQMAHAEMERPNGTGLMLGNLAQTWQQHHVFSWYSPLALHNLFASSAMAWLCTCKSSTLSTGWNC